MHGRRWTLVAGLMTMAIVAAACGSSNSAAGSPTPPASPSPSEASQSPSESPSPSASGSGSGGSGTITIGSDKANNHGSKDVSGASSATVEMDDFYFGPTVIMGTPGQKLTVELENEGSALHNFSITAQSIDTDVQADQKGSVSVTIPQSGFVEFFCKYHKTLEMVGELSAS